MIKIPKYSIIEKKALVVLNALERKIRKKIPCWVDKNSEFCCNFQRREFAGGKVESKYVLFWCNFKDKDNFIHRCDIRNFSISDLLKLDLKDVELIEHFANMIHTQFANFEPEIARLK